MASSMKLSMFSLLIIIVASLLQIQVSCSDLTSWPSMNMRVTITNNLERHEALTVHCKDKNHDLGAHQIGFGQTYDFTISASFTTDYFCGFHFNGVLHWFDIYLQKRDWIRCSDSDRTCDWFVMEAGPCYKHDNCYSWN